MQFKVNSSDLMFHVQKAYSAISTKPVMSILENFKFSVEDGKLTIVATDVESTIITNLLVDSEEEFSFAIPATMLHDTLKSLPSQDIEIIYEGENHNIEIRAMSGEYNLVGQSTDEFPEINAKISQDAIALNSDIIKDAITKTHFATSNDDVRMAMQGIYVEVDYGHINFVATDAHKLVKYHLKNKSNFTQSFILPKKSASLVKNSLAGNEEVKIYVTNTNVYFVTEETEIIARLIDSSYPNYNTVIPTSNNTEIIIDRKELSSALRRIVIYANKTTTGVRFEIGENNIVLKAQDLDFYNKASEEIKASYSGEPMSVGFSGKFLIEMLNVIESEEIMLKISDPKRPTLLLPVDDNENVEVLMLLMPLVVQHM